MPPWRVFFLGSPHDSASRAAIGRYPFACCRSTWIAIGDCGRSAVQNARFYASVSLFVRGPFTSVDSYTFTPFCGVLSCGFLSHGVMSCGVLSVPQSHQPCRVAGLRCSMWFRVVRSKFLFFYSDSHIWNDKSLLYNWQTMSRMMNGTALTPPNGRAKDCSPAEAGTNLPTSKGRKAW